MNVMWKSFGVSMIGPGHIKNGIPNQDCFMEKHSKKFDCIVVSDGVGSCVRSDRGAQVACCAVIDTVSALNIENSLSDINSFVDQIKKNLAGISCFDNPNFSPRFGMHLLMKGVVDRGGTLYFHLHCIAMNYAQGIGVTKSAENAKRIAEIMLEKGYPYGFYTMGQLYQTGVFGKADMAKAKEYYQKGAEQGVPECIEALKSLIQ